MKKSCRNSHVAEATAKARVVTARNRPRTRSAGTPTITATTTPSAVATTMASAHGSCSDRSNRSKGTGMSLPWVSPSTVSPPRPTKAYWPSDSWPAQPVSTVIDSTTMANSRMLVHVNRELLVERVMPRRAKNPKRATNPRALRRRTHHTDSRRLGMARTRGASDQDSCSPVVRITTSTATSTARNRYTSTTERLTESTLARMSASATPTAIPPASVPGSERMRASSDTTSTLSSSGSAMAAVPAWAELMPCSGARKMAVAAANAPEMVHTIVEVRRGDVP